MRIMLDTNVLVSMLLFPTENMNNLLRTIIINHTLVLSSYVINELFVVIERKFPDKINNIEKLLRNMKYEIVYTPVNISEKLVNIRDEFDYPIIHTAIISNIDIFITGDKDFEDLKMHKRSLA